MSHQLAQESQDLLRGSLKMDRLESILRNTSILLLWMMEVMEEEIGTGGNLVGRGRNRTLGWERSHPCVHFASLFLLKNLKAHRSLTIPQLVTMTWASDNYLIHAGHLGWDRKFEKLLEGLTEAPPKIESWLLIRLDCRIPSEFLILYKPIWDTI